MFELLAKRRWLRVVAGLTAGTAMTAAVLVDGFAAQDTSYETPPTLTASRLLPRGALRGPRFRVDGEVPTDGWTTRFTIRSDFGTFEAGGREMLDIRIAELAALERIEEVSKTSVFAESAKRAATKPYHAVKAVVDDPVETAKGIPAGVGRFFKRTYRKAKKGVHAAKDAKADRDARKQQEEAEASGSAEDETAPSDPASGPTQAAAPAASPSPEAARSDDERSTGAKVGDAAKDVFGWSKARREWARQLRIDPYTTNPILSGKLDEIAWAAFAGGFAISTVTPPLPGPVDTVTTVSDLVWTLPPADIEARNEKILKAMGIEGRPVRDFFRNRHFTPTLQTRLVDALERLRGVAGRKGVIPLAAEADSEEDARLLCGAVAILAGLHTGSLPLGELVTGDAGVSALDRSGALVLPLPEDYVSWTAEVAELFDSLAGERKGVWLRGAVSARARRELETRGFSIHENVKSAAAD
jgi:hypothetical protein